MKQLFDLDRDELMTSVHHKAQGLDKVLGDAHAAQRDVAQQPPLRTETEHPRHVLQSQPYRLRDCIAITDKQEFPPSTNSWDQWHATIGERGLEKDMLNHPSTASKRSTKRENGRERTPYRC